ncbi:MAG: DUF4105 domain-containing protein [Gemmatimonadota bacterium]|nr:DUF4105 domain-containing protein [Gemmatimonadota bacterium]
MIAALAALLVFGQVAVVQSPPPPAAGSQLTVYLMTMGPGDQVWEKFGHNAIWIHDATANTDIAYHWGLFDFADEDFLPNFLRGDMRYSMGAFEVEPTIDAYRQTNRTVWAQELDMSPAQRQRLADFVAWNLLPENRFYSYDYYRDNCSTRIRDALDAALGGAIRRQSGSIAQAENAPATYRFHTRRLTQDDVPVYTGTLLGLGQPVDEPITRWEEMFLPVRMMSTLREFTITHDGGQPGKLVRGERVLFHASRAPEPEAVRRELPGYLLAAAGIVAVFVVLLVRAGGRAASPVGPLVIGMVWSTIAGVAGTGLASLWALTNHVYSYRNENLLHMNPLSLLLAVLLLRVVLELRRDGDRSIALNKLTTATRTAIAIGTISALGLALKLLPGLGQVNGEIIALALPVHAAVAGGLLFLSRRLRAVDDARVAQE